MSEARLLSSTDTDAAQNQRAAPRFASSSGNSTTAQLAGGATFTGTIESIFAHTHVSLLIHADQPLRVKLQQFITATDPFPAEEQDYVISAGSAATGGGFSLALNANGNFFRASVTNTGQSATTQLNVNTYYGTIPPTPPHLALFSQTTRRIDPALFLIGVMVYVCFMAAMHVIHQLGS